MGTLGLCLIEDLLLVAHNPISNHTTLNRDPLSVAVIFLWLFSGVFSLFWMFVDLFDRKKRFVWLLPISACGICGLAGLPLALYLFMGRKN
jgi:apolipoprotein N-acyltransferase